VAFAGLIVAALTDGSAHDYARGVFYAAFAAWGWEEATDGANVVRRAVGVAGFVYVVVKVGQALGA
jgi:hypothetical protein